MSMEHMTKRRYALNKLNALDSKGNYSASLAVDGWAVTFGTARRGLAGLRLRPVPSLYRCTKRNSPPINGQCTNHCIAI